MTAASGLSPQELAEASARAMWNEDSASQRLRMRLDHVAPGAATLSMTVTPEMTNGHRIAHGGYVRGGSDRELKTLRVALER